MKRFLDIIDSISNRTGQVFAFFVLAATIVVVVEVVMRYAFNAPPVWGLELTIYLCSVTYMMSGAYAELHKVHVRIDVIYSHWSPRVRAIVDLITGPLFFFGVASMFWVGAEWAFEAFVHGTTSGTPWSPPIWPIRAVIALGSLLLALQGIATFIRDLETARTGKETLVMEKETI